MTLRVGLPLKAVLGVVLCSAWMAGGPAVRGEDRLDVGPKIGEPAPNFTLPDQNGQPRTLDSVKGPRGAVLVFFRSADW